MQQHATAHASTHAYLTSVEGLACIRDPALDVVVVRRTLPPSIESLLDAAVAARPVRCLFEGSASALDADALIGDAFAPLARDFLEEDVMSLALAYAHAARKHHIRLSLQTVEDDACRKFHADYVDVRMVCTYSGPGTEVLDEPGLRRSEMENADPFTVANPKIRGTSALFRATAGDVVVLKGRTYPGNAQRGGVHRSPPIESTASRRLVLKIDGGICGC